MPRHRPATPPDLASDAVSSPASAASPPSSLTPLLAPPPTPPPDSPQSDRLARLALNQAVEPADPLIGRLLEHHTPIEVLAAIHADQLADLDPDPARHDRLADRCVGFRLRLEPGRVEAGLAAAEAVGARFIVPGEPEWPAQLDDLGELRPIGLWAVGRWPPTSIPQSQPPGPRLFAVRAPSPAAVSASAHATEVLSIVGARACTGYGSHIAGALGADLASAGVTVVSGAALGIDAAAHRGALAVGGPTVAVLACGIDRAYPRAHEVLLRAIGERGAVFSELPPGASPTRFRFLHRNRIIAALGAGTVVVEAARRSGSLVTARLAAELGRVVMAVPGLVTSDQSAGTHELIRDGATLVTEARQVREACASLTVASMFARDDAAQSSPTTSARQPKPQEPVDPIEEMVAEALPTARAPSGADVLTLARATGLRPDTVFAALGRLAAMGRAARLGGGWRLAIPP
jgi:DNA processing protein